MIHIVKADGKKLKTLFIDYPFYSGISKAPNYVPPLYGDEKKIIFGKSDYAKDSDSIFFLAFKDGVKKPVGRISGIIQKSYNAAHNEKRVRFTRFDSINDQEVADALLNAVEAWGKENGMDTICGPLDYSDMEREGLLVEGFDQMMTFEEQYHPEYYKALIEKHGYEKEVDYFEFKLLPPKEKDTRLDRIAKIALRMNHLHEAPLEPTKKYIEKYYKGFFRLMNLCYGHLYGTVDFDEESAKATISQFSSILDSRFVPMILNEQGEVVAAGLIFPGLNEALKPSNGKLTLPALLRIRKAVKHPKTIDLGLIAVHPDYQQTGVNAVFLAKMMQLFDMGVESLETNLNLETNTAVISQWKKFNAIQHKKRRIYYSKIK